MSTDIAAGIRVAKSSRYPNGWKEISLQDIKFDKPTVLCLPGDASFHSKDANYMAKYANKLLGRIGAEDNSDIQVISFYYPHGNPTELSNSRTCLRQSDRSSFSQEEQNPQYIQTLYQSCFRPLLHQTNSGKELQKKLRMITFLNFCHGDFVTCKLNEYMSNDLKNNLLYSDKEIADITKQICCISVVPQDLPKKHSFSKIGFVSLDDYHYNSSDSNKVSDFYELDCNETSILGIIERPSQCRHGISRLFYLDNLLDYNSIEDKLNVWLGKTEKLHQMNAYVDIDYHNEFGNKSSEAAIFSQMISRSIQNAVSNSCLNAKSSEFIPLDINNIFQTQTAKFTQGPYEPNHSFLHPAVEETAALAKDNGVKLDKTLYPQTAFISRQIAGKSL